MGNTKHHKCHEKNKSPKRFAAILNGSNEVPPNSSIATGKFIGLLYNNNRLEFALQTLNLRNIIAAHFHDGPPGVNGPVVKSINIDPVTGDAVGSWTANDSEPLTPELVRKLKAGLIYINVHTTTLPGGEIRGQVFKIKTPKINCRCVPKCEKKTKYY